MSFVRLGLKIICAKFGEDWTHCRSSREFFFFHELGFYHKLSCDIHGMSQDIMRQRNHLIKANKSTVIGQNTFLLPAATPNGHMTSNCLDILRKGFRVEILSLVLISQRFEI